MAAATAAASSTQALASSAPSLDAVRFDFAPSNGWLNVHFNPTLQRPRAAQELQRLLSPTIS
eukprot:CAMPEP_0196796938 /NCGR_PEP_ID=MMETSP1104-20130614/38300_1 /TAXON_ID=33652 /ORGANISM="Cafeteria sp., Strain Caron Lab Isolate" /LENGTH=61 /DNA_ID=CAMNT_0042167339 /DNA_START=62 /DNA_END=244 /DNA_ORIENTATION=+